MSENRVIGKNNRIPWHISEDLKRFKRLTEGHVVVMGRKTFESLGKPLPNRLNIIVTHRIEKVIRYLDKTENFRAKTQTYPPDFINFSKSYFEYNKDLVICSSIQTAIDYVSRTQLSVDRSEIFIIGGAQIYKQALPLADKLYLTLIKGRYQGDSFFPRYEKIFSIKAVDKVKEKDGYRYQFLEFVKNNVKKS